MCVCACVHFTQSKNRWAEHKKNRKRSGVQLNPVSYALPLKCVQKETGELK